MSDSSGPGGGWVLWAILADLVVGGCLVFFGGEMVFFGTERSAPKKRQQWFFSDVKAALTSEKNRFFRC